MRGENIVCLSWLPYEPVPLLMHHMMNKLKKGNRVLFVQPAFALATFFLHPSLIPNLKKQWKNWRAGIQRIDDSMYLYTPPPLLLQYGILQANDRFNKRRIERALKIILDEIGFVNPILWVYAPFMIDPSPDFGSKLTIYGCHDEVAAFVNPKRRKLGLTRLERDFIKNADLVFTTTKSLYDAKSRLHSRTYLFPPGVDTEMFEQALSPDVIVPQDLEIIPHPRIGFTGNIDKLRMDWDLILEIARRQPDWHQVLIGPNTDPIPAFMKNIENVHFLGKKPLTDLPAYFKGLDVCYMPYRQGDWSKHAFPAKTFEHLASGKSVVSVFIPALKDFDSVLYLCESKDEFIQAIGSALDEGEEKIEERVRVARANTWDERVKKVTEVIESYARDRGITIDSG
jgi:hypothetical protein